MRYLLLFASVLAFSSLFTACNKNDFEDAKLAEHDAEFAFPLFNTNITLKDLMFNVLNDTLSGDTLFVNPDQTMTLYYTGDVARKDATDIFDFLADGGFPLTDTPYTKAPLQAPQGVTIRSANLKKGSVSLTCIANQTPDTLKGTLFIPQMTRDGKVFSYDFAVPPGVLFWKTPLIDISGWELKSDSNNLQFGYRAYNAKGEPIKMVAFGGPSLVVGFFGLEFSYLEGYWGYSSYPLTRDTIDIDINKTDLDGNIQVKNPKVTMRIANSWGFPTRGVVKYLSFLGKDGQEYPLESPTVFNNDSIDFNWPSIVKNEVGQTKYTYVKLDETNSNIAEIFNAQPVRLIYEVEGVSNAAKDPNIIGFLTDQSSISLSMQVELLLEGTARNFGADQTLELNFGDYARLDSSDIQNVEFKLVAENSTPVSSELQIYFQDDNGQTLDSLFTGGPRFIMEAAPVDAQGVSTGIQRTENFVAMDIERFNVIRKAKKAYMTTSFTTAKGGTQPVKLLATNSTTVKMGLKVKTKL